MVRRACVGRVGGVLEGGLKRIFQVELIALRIGRDASREVCFEIRGTFPLVLRFVQGFVGYCILARLPLGAPFGRSPASHRTLSGTPFGRIPVGHALRPESYPDAPFDRSLVGRAYFLGKCTRSRLCYRKTHETYQRGGKPPLFYCEIIQISQHNTK